MLISIEKIPPILAAADATLNQQGWENPPMLADLIKVPGGHRLSELPFEITKPPALYLKMLVETLEDDEQDTADLVQAMGAATNFVGILFAVETWGHEGTADERWKLTENGTKSLADIPGSFEVRLITLVDVYGRVAVLHRRRGEEPEYGTRTAVEWFLPHMTVHYLTRLVRVLAKQTSGGDNDMTALDRLVLKSRPALRSRHS